MLFSNENCAVSYCANCVSNVSVIVSPLMQNCASKDVIVSEPAFCIEKSISLSPAGMMSPMSMLCTLASIASNLDISKSSKYQQLILLELPWK